MTPQRLAAFRLSEELHEALQTIKDRDGIPISEQVRRAIEGWAKSRGVNVKAERKRAISRKRS